MTRSPTGPPHAAPPYQPHRPAPLTGPAASPARRRSPLRWIIGLVATALLATGCGFEEVTVTASPFGETVDWEGLEVTVTGPEPFTPSEFAFGHDQAVAVLFEFRAVNTGTEPWEPMSSFAIVESEGWEAWEIFDEGLDGPPLTTVLPGRDVVWRQAWSVDDPAEIDLMFNPGLASSPSHLAHYTNY